MLLVNLQAFMSIGDGINGYVQEGSQNIGERFADDYVVINYQNGVCYCYSL